MKNKILALLGIFAIVFAGYITSVNALTSNSKIDDEFLKRNEYQTSVVGKIESTMKDTYKNSYPSYYGGIYINDDSTGIILQIVEDNVPSKDSEEYSVYNKIINMDSNIKIEYVKNSYNDLNNINDQIIEYYKAADYSIAKAGFKDYVANYVDIVNNTVVVELLDSENSKVVMSEAKLQTLTDSFKNLVVDSNLIKYVQGKELSDQATTLKAGAGISVSGGTCSMGYRSRVGGKDGYITAGHCVNGLNTTIPTGTVKKYQYSGKVDAAFVQTTSSYSPSNDLAYTSGSVTYLNATMCPVLSVGGAIAHAGVTSGYKAGTIKSLNYSGNYGGTVFTNLIATDYISAGGDSGGPAFVPRSNGALVAGIHKGTSSYGAAVVNADNIYAAFGDVRY